MSAPRQVKRSEARRYLDLEERRVEEVRMESTTSVVMHLKNMLLIRPESVLAVSVFPLMMKKPLSSSAALLRVHWPGFRQSLRVAPLGKCVQLKRAPEDIAASERSGRGLEV
jgi:hypothetical protein